ncbi:tRNA-methyltransferase family protein [Cryptosporidium andersoni]|uniref:tRNA (guanine-N(7)-)-methyltransferase n=1 Tax=Cryptosporidium andersoni TaxID=117008 RepID=A0A1J4MJP7_9CRYT|nr:tRNA-methyltransferase family protein [Cryptosporidium andersoni]
MITEDEITKPPQKKFYRQRAHCNPLADNFMIHPISPNYIDWTLHYPNYLNTEYQKVLYLNTKKYPINYGNKVCDHQNTTYNVKILDIGCGYGGLLVWLSTQFPNKLSLGLEIREKVTNYVGERILAMQQNGRARNISVIKTNAMKYLPNYIKKHQLEKIFICFPDPHFKKRNWRRRIISYSIIPLYWYLLQQDGLLYVVSDVLEYFEWTINVLKKFSDLFERVPDIELKSDPCIDAIKTNTEEAKKVERSNSPSYECVFRRL